MVAFAERSIIRVFRCTNAQRTTITPLDGEFLWVTDTDQLFIGDGTTAGGLGPLFRSGQALTASSIINASTYFGGGFLFAQADPIYMELRNGAASNADGARAASVRFAGLKADATIHELARLRGEHDGSGNDTLGRLVLLLNTGSGIAEVCQWDSSGRMVMPTGKAVVLNRLGDPADPTKLLDLDLTGLTTATTRKVVMPDRQVHLADGLCIVTGGLRVSSSTTDAVVAVSNGEDYVAPFAGHVVALSARTATAPGGGSTGDVDLWHNGSDLGGTLTVQLTSAARSPFQVLGTPYAFAAGDRLGMKITTSAGWGTLVGVTGFLHIVARNTVGAA